MTHSTPTAATSASPPPRGRVVATLALALALLTFLASQTTAQVIPTGTPAADILLSQAITEHRVFLTCSALDPATHAQITDNWQRDVTAAATILTGNNVPPEAVTAFTTAAKPENLMPAEDTPWGQIKALCATRPDWQNAYYQFSLTVLELKLPAAFE